MKNYALLPLILIYNALSAQDYVSIDKARKNSESIQIASTADLRIFLKHEKRFRNVSAIKCNTVDMNRIEIDTFISTASGLGDLTDLEIEYIFDSLQTEQLTRIATLQNLNLICRSQEYGDLSVLNKLKDLSALGIYIERIEQLPVSVFELKELYEIELIGENKDPEAYSQMMLTEMDTMRRSNKILFSSENKQLDLGSDSILSKLLALNDNLRTYTGTSAGNTFKRQEYLKPKTVANTFKPLPGFKPLFKDEAVKTETVKIDSRNPEKIIFNDNTVLNIPQNAFRTSDGKIYNGDVDIKYTGIRTQADMLRTGITMTYDTAGNTELFKSNGMFELRAYAGNDELSLADGKSIEMGFVSNTDSSQFNLYSMKEANASWEYQMPLFSAGSVITKTLKFVSMKDMTEFNDRYLNFEYYYCMPRTLSKSVVEIPKIKRNKPSDNGNYFLRNNMKGSRYALNIYSPRTHSVKINSKKSLIKIRSFSRNNDLNEKEIFFNLYGSEQVNSGSNTMDLFPELSSFLNYDFKYEGKLNSLEFGKKFKRNKHYSDIRIYYEPGSATAVLELKYEDGFAEIPVDIMIRNSKGKEYIDRRFLRAFNKYKQILQIKENKFNAALYADYSRYSIFDTVLYKITYLTVQSGLRYDAPTVDPLKYPVNNPRQTMYRINIQVLGLFNCDQLYRMRDSRNIVNASFYDQDSTLIKASTVYVVDRYAGGTYTFDPSKFSYSKTNTSGVLVRDADGMIYTLIGQHFIDQMKEEKRRNPKIVLQKAEKVSNSDQALQALK